MHQLIAFVQVNLFVVSTCIDLTSFYSGFSDLIMHFLYLLQTVQMKPCENEGASGTHPYIGIPNAVANSTVSESESDLLPGKS